MFYDRNSEDLELPNFPSEDNIPKPEEKEEAVKSNKKKKIIILIIIIIIIIGLIIFLVIYFTSRNKNGGYINVIHQIGNDGSIKILNSENLKNSDYTIEKEQTILDDSIKIRLLEDIFTIDKNNIFRFTDNEKREGRIKFKIKFKKVLTSISGMFQSLNTLIRVDMSNLKSDKIQNMNSAFLDCTQLEYINFTNYNSEKLESMDSTFENCRELTEIDLSSFETPKLRSMRSTFKNCENLSFLELNKFVLNNVDTTDTFGNNKNLYYNSIKINDEKTKELLNSAMYSGNNNNINENQMKCDKGPGEKCKECRTEDNLGHQCLSCNEEYYLPSFLKNPIKCKQCYKTCRKCTDYLVCIECKDNYELKQGKCLIKTIEETDSQPSISDDLSDENKDSDTTKPSESDIKSTDIIDTIKPFNTDIISTDVITDTKDVITTDVITDSIKPFESDVASAYITTDSIKPFESDETSTYVTTDSIKPFESDEASTKEITDTIKPLESDVVSTDINIESDTSADKTDLTDLTDLTDEITDYQKESESDNMT